MLQSPENSATNASPANLQPSGLHRSAPVNTPAQITASNSTPASVAAPTPLGKRPKGRLFVAFTILTVVGFFGNYVYQSYYATVAYGNVTARVIRVSPAWHGSVDGIFVTEGDSVRTEELLVTVNNPSIEQQIANAGDRLKFAQADLNASLVRLSLETEIRTDRRKKSVAEYYQAWGDLLTEKSFLAELNTKLKASQYLHEHDSVSDVDHAALQLKVFGQQEKIERIESAVNELKRRTETESSKPNAAKLLEPKFVAIENIQDEIARLRKSAENDRLISPVNGQVVRINHFAGERVGAGESVIEIAEEGSLEIELFVVQSQLDQLRVGQEIEVLVNSGQEVTCRVERLGLQFRTPPSNLVRFYPSQQKVLPVYLKPVRNGQQDATLFIDSQVRLPRSWSLRDLPFLQNNAEKRDEKSNATVRATSDRSSRS